LGPLNFNDSKIRDDATWPVVLSFSQVAEADFSFALAEAEPAAARAAPAAVSAQVLAWLPASVEEERVCFEVAALAVGVAAVLAADALAAEPVAVADAGELVLACSALAEAFAADGLAAELVAGAGAAELVADAAEALAADELVAEPVVDVAAEQELACFELGAVPAAGELAAELVAGARAAALPVD
jgi:hypothetical protein